jgi:hypothetical protein
VASAVWRHRTITDLGDEIMRFRSRFSMRTLVIFVTLVCAYFGAWEATRVHGVHDVRHRALLSANSVTAIAPLTVRTHAQYLCQPDPETRYYLWLFGPTIKLHFESEWKEFSEFPNRLVSPVPPFVMPWIKVDRRLRSETEYQKVLPSPRRVSMIERVLQL